MEASLLHRELPGQSQPGACCGLYGVATCRLWQTTSTGVLAKKPGAQRKLRAGFAWAMGLTLSIWTELLSMVLGCWGALTKDCRATAASKPTDREARVYVPGIPDAAEPDNVFNARTCGPHSQQRPQTLY